MIAGMTAMNNRQLDQIFTRLNHQLTDQEQSQLVGQYLTEGVIAVLQEERLMGEVLLQLQREVNVDTPGALALIWRGNDLVLAANPQLLATVIPDQLVALLMHEALHVVWRHPLRYATVADQANVKVACDIAVNQYLANPPQGTATLADLQRLLHQRVKAHQDSADYLQLIRHHHLTFQGQLTNPGQSLSGQSYPTTKTCPRPGKPAGVILDSHDGWLVTSEQQAQLHLKRNAHLQRLLNHAWQKTPAKQRGLLPGDVRQALQPTTVQRPARWIRQLRLWLGTVPHGKQDSRGRFNRRQPYRMELPGQVTRYVNQLLVFVDNSGSMSDEEISHLLSQINALAQRRSTEVTILPFDAVVHPEGKQVLKNHQRLRYQRVGGGGTRFQAIFDYLRQERVKKSTLIMIMTDGWGESTVQLSGYHNVVWLVTTSPNDLSVANPGGMVISIEGGDGHS